MTFNKETGYGRALLDAVSAQIPTFGRIFIVRNANDSAQPNFAAFDEIFKNDPDGIVRLYTDLATAYAATTSGNNDVICLDGGGTSHKLTSMLTVAKNKVHFIGFDGGGRLENQRALISTSGAGAASDVSLIKITGTGCSFRNIKISNGFTVAQNLSAVLDYGNNSLFLNCTIHNLGSAHLTNASSAPLILAGGDSEYIACNIGSDTLQSTAVSGQTVLVAKGTSAQAATRCIFKDCTFRSFTSQTTHVFFRVSADGDIDRNILIDSPKFLNFNSGSQGATLAAAVSASASLTSGSVLVINPTQLAVTKLAVSTTNANVFVSNNVANTAASATAIITTA